MNDSRNIADPDVRMLTGIAASLYADYEDDDLSWAGSPFAWIKSRPSRQRGKIGEQLVAGFFAAKNFDVAKSPDSEADRIIGGVRVEISFPHCGRLIPTSFSNSVTRTTTSESGSE